MTSQKLPPSHAPAISSSDRTPNPHYAAIGGAPAITQLVQRFYAHMRARPEAATILAWHPPELGPVMAALERYLAEWLGGPALYSSEPGHPRLRRRHKRFAIGPAERDAWLACMRDALADVVIDPQLRAELAEAFSKNANFLRNDPEHPHEHHGAGTHHEHE